MMMDGLRMMMMNGRRWRWVVVMMLLRWLITHMALHKEGEEKRGGGCIKSRDQTTMSETRVEMKNEDSDRVTM
jgi:hypothetical protein